jgi:hypothetical protein
MARDEIEALAPHSPLEAMLTAAARRPRHAPRAPAPTYVPVEGPADTARVCGERVYADLSSNRCCPSAFFFATSGYAAGPISPVNVGNWRGGSYTNDSTGKFSHCAVSASYRSGMIFSVAVGIVYSWRFGFTNNAWRLSSFGSVRSTLDPAASRPQSLRCPEAAGCRSRHSERVPPRFLRKPPLFWTRCRRARPGR